MHVNLNAARGVILLVVVSLILPACSTAQLQKQYTSFDTCFREQKVVAGLAGGLIGGVIGGAVGGSGDRGKVLAVAGAVAGAILGQKAAWQSCLQAFPPRGQTTLEATRAEVAAASAGGRTGGAPVTDSLAIRSLTAQPLVFGRDLQVAAQYTFVSNRPEARDVKARVSRNLIFVTPDGQRQEITSSSEDTIQQGMSRSTFAIPTPSAQDAKELLQTRDWAVRFVVEAEGKRTEQIVPLQVPELVGAQGNAAKATTGQQPQGGPTRVADPQPAAAPPSVTPSELVVVPAGTRLVAAPNATAVTARTTQRENARVMQRTEIRQEKWIQVDRKSVV